MLVGISAIGQQCGSDEEANPVDCTENPVVLNIVSVEGSNCASSDGSIEVSATGGSGNYQYQIEDGPLQTSAVFNDISAGVYTVTATDDNNCSASMDVSVNNLSGLNITFETSPGGCKSANGTLEVNATDGTEPYQFKIDNGSFGTTSTFTNLSTGKHTLVVSDATGCEITQSVTIASGISFTSAIAPIISTKCAVSGCHNGSQAPDFRSFTNIKANASQIKTLTGNRTMPQEGSLTQSQIDMIACWVDDGALQN